MQKYTIYAVTSKTFKTTTATQSVLNYTTTWDIEAENDIKALKQAESFLSILEREEYNLQQELIKETREKYPTKEIEMLPVEIVGYAVMDENKRYKFFDVAYREVEVKAFLDIVRQRLSDVVLKYID